MVSSVLSHFTFYICILTIVPSFYSNQSVELSLLGDRFFHVLCTAALSKKHIHDLRNEEEKNYFVVQRLERGKRVFKSL